MNRDILAQKINSLIFKHYYFARLCVALTVIIAFVGTFFGRKIERAFPVLVTILPLGLISVLTISFFIVVGYVASLVKHYNFRAKKLSFIKGGLLTIVFVELGVLICESSIIFPLERVHFVKYSMLSFFLFYSQRQRPPIARSLIAIGIAAVTGISEESLQLFVPNRHFDPRDIGMNVVSAILGGTYALSVYAWMKESFYRNPHPAHLLKLQKS